MSAIPETKVDDVKPVEAPTAVTASEPAVTEPVTAPAAAAAAPEETAAAETKPLPVVPAAEPTAESTPAATKHEEKTAEPITSGVLGYKAPKLLKQFIFSKRQVWLGDEPVSNQELNHYLRSTEAKVAHPVAAWSAQTGKGILFIVKTDADKKYPHDALLLADATELLKDSPHEFSFKIHGDKHAFKAKDEAERDGWYGAIQHAVTEAKASKEGILSSDSYKDSIKHLGKPAALAGGVAAGAGAAAAAAKHEEKKDAAKTEPSAAAATEPAEAPAATATPVKDEEKKRTGSRSASRGKRTSIFGALKNKKDEVEHKAEAKKEQKKEEKAVKDEKHDDKTHAAEGAAAGTAAVGAGAAAVVATEHKEEDKVELPTEAAPAAATEVKPAESAEPATVTPKPAKRNSIFGSFYQKVRSPNSEKKESDVVPVVPAKDATAATETPAAAATTEATETKPVEPLAATTDKPVEETAVPAAAATTTEEKKEEKAATPKKEKESFLGNLLGLANRARSPSSKREKEVEKTEKAVNGPAVPPKDATATTAPKVDEPAAVATTTEATGTAATVGDATATEAPAAATTAAAPALAEEAPVAPASTPAAVEETPAAATETKPATGTTKENRRRSIFGGFGNKKEGEAEGEKPLEKLGALFRKPSQAIRNATGKGEAKKENTTPVKTVEETPVAETKPAVEEPIAKTDQKSVDSEKPSGAIGDVVPEAVTVGQPQPSNPTVSATA